MYQGLFPAKLLFCHDVYDMVESELDPEVWLYTLTCLRDFMDETITLNSINAFSGYTDGKLREGETLWQDALSYSIIAHDLRGQNRAGFFLHCLLSMLHGRSTLGDITAYLAKMRPQLGLGKTQEMQKDPTDNRFILGLSSQHP